MPIRHRSWRIVAGFVLGWGVVMTPWLAKNVIDAGNPVYPLANRVFGGQSPGSGAGSQVERMRTAPRRSRSSLWDSDRGRGRPVRLAVSALFARPPGPLSLGFAVGRLWRSGATCSTCSRPGGCLTPTALDRFWLPLRSVGRFGGPGCRLDSEPDLVGAPGSDLYRGHRARTLAYSSTALTGFNEWTGDLQVLRRSGAGDAQSAARPARRRAPRGCQALARRTGGGLPSRASGCLLTRFSTTRRSRFSREDERLPRSPRRPGERGIAHVYVDWFEIERYRSPAELRSSHLTLRPSCLAGLVAAGCSTTRSRWASRQQLFRVRGPKPRG